jgi:hypothetical protein
VAETVKIAGRWNDGAVDTARVDSHANLDLIAELAAMGITSVTSRKLERWRQAGALPRMLRESRGRAGTVTRWPPGTARQVAALVGLLDQGVTLRRCPVALFVLGFSIDVAVLRACYLDLYREIETGLAGLAPDPAEVPDPLDRADAVAQSVVRGAGRRSMTRRWERRIRRDAPRAVTLARLQDALFTTMTGLVAGETPTAEGISDLLSVAGLDGQQDPGAVAGVLSSLHQERTVAVIRDATLADWEQARAACADMFEWMRLQRAAETLVWDDEQRLTGLDDFARFFDDSTIVSRAELIPAFLVLATPDWVDALTVQLGQLRAFAAISADLPQVFGPAAVRDQRTMTDRQREEAAVLIAEWARAHPEEAAILETLWNAG